MRRRVFLGIMGTAVVSWPLVAHAQGERVRRIGIVMPFPPTNVEIQARVRAFRDELRKRGWATGVNVQFEERWTGDNMDLIRSACGRGPAEYVPRLREKLAIDDERWGRLCAEHALPPAWELMEYKEFLRERRRRMADIIRVAFRQLGGEPDSPPLTPPWFLPGAEDVWLRIAETERALRGVVREVYAALFGEAAAQRIEEALPERERETLARALRARPAGSDPLSVVDYLYLGQLPPLLFASDAWQHARHHFGGVRDGKQRLQSAVGQIVPVRNEIAHVREVDRDRLLRASVACADVLEMLQGLSQ